MSFSYYSDVGARMAVDLVNTIDRVSGQDDLADVQGLVAFLARHEGKWHRDDPAGRPTEADLEGVRRLRERLRAVFDAGSPEVAAATLNSVLSDVVATPRLSVDGPAPRFRIEPIEGRIPEWLGAAAAMGLAAVLVDHGIERFGTCAAHDCVDAFVDTSKNRSRRHCSTTCSNRENVAAHRARSRNKSAK